ncbi:ATP-binding protein [Streptomyces sp. NPDC058662]|uniref:ATP-binding protein n=1 Tax=Streptomyces sp. NPDC058662 TaxID=3346583 RepID=UPI0036592ED8
MISHSRRHCVVELQALPSRIGQVRRIVAAQLRHWQLDPLIDRAALGVTELLSNVHRHAQPDKTCTVEIELRLGRVTVSVIDSDPRLPVLRETGAHVSRTPEALETCGRGLALVAAVSEAWGARQYDDRPGKVVWFSLTTAHALSAPPPPVRIEVEPAQEPLRPVLISMDAGAVGTGGDTGTGTGPEIDIEIDIGVAGPPVVMPAGTRSGTGGAETAAGSRTG